MEYLNMKSSNEQKHKYIYIYHPIKYTGRTAKNMYITRKEKHTCVIPQKYVQSQKNE